jgi:hypothetical protein
MMRFRLAAGVTDATFLAIDGRLQVEFAYQQKGLLRRTTARNGDDWIVVDIWASEAEADACSERWGSDPVVAEFMALLDPASISSERYFPIPG